MRRVTSAIILFVTAGLSACGVKQSVCMDDPFQLMKEVFVTNCEGRFELTREDSFYWVSQGKIPSKCTSIQVTGIDSAGQGYSYEQYKNDAFEAASSGEFIISSEDEVELNWLYLSNKRRGETCEAQIARHRERYAENRAKFGPRSKLPQNYEIVPLEK